MACAVIGIIISIPWFAKLPEYNKAMQLYYDKNYPEATWAFDELGGYRDAQEMKEKAELSWRKSLANITSTPYVFEEYYVNANGSVDTFDYAPGVINEDYSINEHGEVVSVELQGGIVPLYADGYTIYKDFWSQKKLIFENIIKITPYFEGGSVALKDDGTLIVNCPEENSENNAWIKKVETWKDIIDIEYYRSEKNTANDLIAQSGIVGIKSDNTLEFVFNDMWVDNQEFDDSIIRQFKNIKK